MNRSKQQNFFPPVKLEHGGSHSLGVRRGKRPLTTKRPLHVTSRSPFAVGKRSLKFNAKLLRQVADEYAKRFNVKIYIYSLNARHIHYLIQGKTLEGIRNFIRAFLGRVAALLLEKYPIGSLPEDSQIQSALPEKTGCKKNQRVFWEMLVYSRVVSWGRDYFNVVRYIKQNILESLNRIAYQPRENKKKRRKHPA